MTKLDPYWQEVEAKLHEVAKLFDGQLNTPELQENFAAAFAKVLQDYPIAKQAFDKISRDSQVDL